MNYRLRVTILTLDYHEPVSFRVDIPEPLAKLIMNTKVRAVRLLMEENLGLTSVPSQLIDYTGKPLPERSFDIIKNEVKNENTRRKK